MVPKTRRDPRQTSPRLARRRRRVERNIDPAGLRCMCHHQIHVRARAFTLLDCLVLLMVLILMAGALFGFRVSASGGSSKIKCSMNLKQIGLAMLIYANDNNHKFPAARWDPDDPQIRSFTNWDAPDPIIGEAS